MIISIPDFLNYLLALREHNFLHTWYFLKQFFPNHIYLFWNVQKWGLFVGRASLEPLDLSKPMSKSGNIGNLIWSQGDPYLKKTVIWRWIFEVQAKGGMNELFPLPFHPQTLPEALVSCVGKLISSALCFFLNDRKNIYFSWRNFILKKKIRDFLENPKIFEKSFGKIEKKLRFY